jgi:hypothetical protein
VTAPWYCTREDIKRALDVKETARNNDQVDRAAAAATASVDEQMHTRPGGFYPWAGTRVFDWPDGYSDDRWRVWLSEWTLAEATSVSAGGTAVTGYLLSPEDGPPYVSVDIDRSTSDTFEVGDYAQRRVSVTGTFADAPVVTAPAGALESAVADADATTITLTDGAAAGVGQLLVIGDERLIVTGRSMVDTTQNLADDLTASMNVEIVPVGDGSAFVEGEVVMIDAEKMLVVEIAGNNLIVKRGWDGSTLAAHTTGADVYAPRRLTVERGALGTTAAQHADAAAVRKHLVPPLIRQLSIAEALVNMQQENSGYGGKIGSGDSERPAAGAGIEDLRARAYAAHGRKVF